ncbi:acyltransferase [Litoribacter alkaliphilus]|uniref:Acyltransferase n=1 Tax=Litoribacter ruber TaxID=702568 RepID=A0AAP2CEX9_9BACT|nr:acyltransferase [Litoribacter alkaliphilus]MBS9523188.1 acyltransferase [Litoribacter alkaliphilus]
MPLIPETRLFGLKNKLYKIAGATIGRGVRICSSVQIRGIGELSIGDHTWVGHNSHIISACNIVIGKNVDIAPNVFFTTGSHQINMSGERIAGKGIQEAINIGDGSWIAAGAIILPGTSIGNKCIVAAGAVVKGSFPDNSLIGGVPAKLIKQLI